MSLALINPQMRLFGTTSPVSTAITPQRAPGMAGTTDSNSASPAPHRNRFSVSRTAGTMPVYNPNVGSAAFADTKTIPTGVDESQRLGFKDLLDVINPLQHIPGISTMYQKATGDNISPAAQFMGAMLFGGPIGAAVSMVDIAIKDKTGDGFTANMAALVSGDSEHAFTLKKPPTDTPIETASGTFVPAPHAFKTAPRMAGTQPVWQNNLSGGTHFAALMANLNT